MCEASVEGQTELATVRALGGQETRVGEFFQSRRYYLEAKH